MRLFLAAWPPSPVVEALHGLVAAGMAAPEVRPVDRAQWHVTIRFLGEADPDEVGRCLDGVALPAATAVIEPVPVLLGDHAVVLPVTGLDALAARVGELVAGVGTGSRWPFVGHLPVGRVRRGGGHDRGSGPGAAAPVSFPVGRLHLLRSDQVDGEHRYTPVASWPLGVTAPE